MWLGARPEEDFVSRDQLAKHSEPVKAAFEHPRDTIAAFRDAGVLPDMVQIGNDASTACSGRMETIFKPRRRESFGWPLTRCVEVWRNRTESRLSLALPSRAENVVPCVEIRNKSHREPIPNTRFCHRVDKIPATANCRSCRRRPKVCILREPRRFPLYSPAQLCFRSSISGR